METSGNNIGKIKNGKSGSYENEDEDKHYLYTDINLSTSNLGSVAGDVTLTLKGNTKVGTLEGDASTLKEGTGNVYGGGDQSYVYNEDDTNPNKGEETKASTIVNLQGNTIVYGNVFGGGNNGKVSGNTTVNIGKPETTSDSGDDTGGESNP